jgi:hypothetical protein
MEPKIIWLIAFAVLLLAMNYCTNRAHKHVVPDFERRIKLAHKWKILVMTFLYHIPYNLLTNKGKKWQTSVYLLLIPTLFVSYQLGQIAK